MYNTHQKFDTTIRPCRPAWFMKVIEFVVVNVYYKPKGMVIRKHGMEGLKPPYIILSSHGSLVDFPIVMKAVFPYASTWLASIEEFIHREYLMRKAGVTYKRKFTADTTVVRHLFHIIKRNKDILTIYPEARFSFVGINEPIDDALGEFVKRCGCPVIVNINHGNYLRSPQWGKSPERKVRTESDFYCLFDAEQVKNATADEIQKRIEETFVYDEYAWQRDNKIKIKCKQRARGIHRVLYKCPECGTESEMASDGAELWCKHCGAKWHMDEYGVMHGVGHETRFSHIPDWYRWERAEVADEIASGNYHYSENAEIGILASSAKGVVRCGKGVLTHDYDGFKFVGEVDGEPFELERKPQSMMSCHIEYNLKKTGPCVELCNLNDTYFVYPESGDKKLTRLHFACIEMHEYAKKTKQAE